MSGNAAVALDVRDVSKVFVPPSYWLRRKTPNRKQVKQALKDISFQIKEGEMVGLLGPNGAGKTTLSKIITTLMHPSSGHVHLWGEDIRTDPYKARQMMGLVTCDERSFYWRLTGKQNLSFFGALYGVSKADLAERSAELLDTLGLTVAANAPYHTYSSGMKQKLAIARGLLSQPRFLIYDEPTRSLDPLSAQNIRNWIAEQRERFPQQTHLLATNQLVEADMLCDRVIVINGGRLIAAGTLAEFQQRWDLRDTEHHTLDVFGATLTPPSWMTDDAEIVNLTIEPGDEGAVVRLIATRESNALSRVMEWLLSEGAKVGRCTTETMSLDEAFCALIEAQNDPESAELTGGESQ